MHHCWYLSQQSINLTCKTNLTPLPEIQSNIPNCIKPSYQPVITILHHYLYISQQSSKPSCIFNLTSLPITPIYYPYLITNLLPLPVSNTPTCITTHTHMYTSWSWQILIPIDPNAPVWLFSFYWKDILLSFHIHIWLSNVFGFIRTRLIYLTIYSVNI